MNKSNLILSLITMGLILVSSCKKDPASPSDDEDSSNDTNSPKITISKPTAMQMYNNGDTVWMKASVTDESLHELLIILRNDADNSILYQSAPTVHDLTSYDVNTFWKSQVTDHTNATLIIAAEDHASHITADTVHIHIMP